MPSWLIGKLLAPFAVFALAVAVLTPARRAIERRMQEGWFKRLLLRRVGP